MSRPASLRPTATGTYYRQLGYTATRTQPRFNLGTSKAEAIERNAKLEAMWKLVCERHEAIHGGETTQRHHRDGEQTKPPPTYWDEVSLEIARRIAGGATRFVLPPNPEMQGADSYLHWVGRYAEAFGSVIPVVPADPDLYAEGVAPASGSTGISTRRRPARARWPTPRVAARCGSRPVRRSTKPSPSTEGMSESPTGTRKTG